MVLGGVPANSAILGKGCSHERPQHLDAAFLLSPSYFLTLTPSRNTVGVGKVKESVPFNEEGVRAGSDLTRKAGGQGDTARVMPGFLRKKDNPTHCQCDG